MPPAPGGVCQPPAATPTSPSQPVLTCALPVPTCPHLRFARPNLSQPALCPSQPVLTCALPVPTCLNLRFARPNLSEPALCPSQPVPTCPCAGAVGQAQGTWCG
eukprot:350411-Chlamydomonas_euryale.AAC.2